MPGLLRDVLDKYIDDIINGYKNWNAVFKIPITKLIAIIIISILKKHPVIFSAILRAIIITIRLRIKENNELIKVSPNAKLLYLSLLYFKVLFLWIVI